MNNTGRSECRVTGRQKLDLLANLNHATALQNDVEFVLSFVRVRCVLLIGLKTIQTNKEKLTLRYSALGHFVWRKLSGVRDSLHEHSCQFTPE
jgi:hypothetical protein